MAGFKDWAIQQAILPCNVLSKLTLDPRLSNAVKHMIVNFYTAKISVRKQIVLYLFKYVVSFKIFAKVVVDFR